MPGKIVIKIITGPLSGKEMIFDRYETIMLGRLPECHISISDDQSISRYHFMLEINPPLAKLKDLGSLNGTWVNGIQLGGRHKSENSSQHINKKEVALNDGDKIEVGNTIIEVRIKEPILCCDCGKEILSDNIERYKWIGETYICSKCSNDMNVSFEHFNYVFEKKQQNERRNNLQEGLVHNGGPVSSETDLLKTISIPVNANVSDHQNKSEFQHIYNIKIPGYKLLRQIGKGGSGEVYLAESINGEKKAAIKLMPFNQSNCDNSVHHFLRESENLINLNHKNIVKIYDYGSSDNFCYFVMEYCNRGSVADLMSIHGGKLSLDMAVSIILEALNGLSYLHEKNFVHRDIKPANILLAGNNQNLTAKISDFGISKNFQEAGLSGMTLTGVFSGTLSFMPREQLINFKYVRPESDIWSIGATFYYMITGRVPRKKERSQDQVESILINEILPVNKIDSSISQNINQLIMRALHHDPNKRYKDASELKKHLMKINTRGD